MLSPGVVLSNRYLLNERIAAGGMGEVWRGTDQLLQRGIAVKVLLPALMSDAEFITRFRTEARMMAALRHPGIVQVYDYGEDAAVGGSKLDYLVMEYIDGTPLSKRIQAAGRLGVTESLAILAQAAEALQVAHEAGIVHRDVKPSNLLVRPGGAVVLVDFGVARSTGITGITSTNVVLGSAHYMAPEQAEGKPVSPATDVYALGAVAYSCLAGRPPFVGDNPMQVLAQLVHGAPPTLPPDVPAPVAAIVLRALDREPARRFPTAAALAEAARSPQPVPESPSGIFPPSGVFSPSGSFSAGRPGSGAGPQPGGHAVSGQAFPGVPSGGQPVSGPGLPGMPSGGQPVSGQAFPGVPAGGQAVSGQAFAGMSSGGQAVSGAALAGPAGSAPPAAGPAFAAGRAEYPGNPYYGGPTGPTGAVPAAASGDPGGGKRRRNATVAALAAAALIGVVGVVVAVSLGQRASQADTQPSRGGAVGDGPVIGGGPRELPGRGGQGRPNQPAGPLPGQTPGGTSPTSPHGRTRTSATAAPTTAPTSPGATATSTPATTPPTSGSTANPYTPKRVCGSSFAVIDSAALRSGGVTVGKVVLMYNSANGKNCVVTLKTTQVGTASAASAYLEVQDGSRGADSGSFEYYAGPVKAAAAGVCVKWGGSVGGVAYDSPFEHCG